MYKLCYLMEFSLGRSGLMVPVFCRAESNMLYVQSMDEFLYIKNFSPYLCADEYNLLDIPVEVTVDVGSPGIIAMRKHDGAVFFGNISDVFSYYDEFKDHIKCHKLLNVQILRLMSASLSEQYDAWTSLSDKVSTEKNKKTRWVNLELELFQKNDEIWKKINRKNRSKNNVSGVIIGESSQYDLETLLSTLSNRRNFDAVDWHMAWMYLYENMPNDERIFYLGEQWLYHRVLIRKM